VARHSKTGILRNTDLLRQLFWVFYAHVFECFFWTWCITSRDCTCVERYDVKYCNGPFAMDEDPDHSQRPLFPRKGLLFKRVCVCAPRAVLHTKHRPWSCRVPSSAVAPGLPCQPCSLHMRFSF